MDQETQGWLVGVPFDTNHDTPHERLRLSPRHKRELANLTGIVMASTVFFITPLLVSAPGPSALEPGSAVEGPSPSEVTGPGPSGVEGPGPSEVDGASAIESPGPNAVEGVEPSQDSRPALESPVLLASTLTRTESSPAPRSVAAPASGRQSRPVVSRPSPEALVLRRSSSSSRPAAVRAVNASLSTARMKERDRRRKGISNGLLRVLVGSGRHRVHPFPIPVAED